MSKFEIKIKQTFVANFCVDADGNEQAIRSASRLLNKNIREGNICAIACDEHEEVLSCQEIKKGERNENNPKK